MKEICTTNIRMKKIKKKTKPREILDVLLNLPSVAGVRATLLQSELGTNLLSNGE